MANPLKINPWETAPGAFAADRRPLPDDRPKLDIKFTIGIPKRRTFWRGRGRVPSGVPDSCAGVYVCKILRRPGCYFRIIVGTSSGR